MAANLRLAWKSPFAAIDKFALGEAVCHVVCDSLLDIDRAVDAWCATGDVDGLVAAAERVRGDLLTMLKTAMPGAWEAAEAAAVRRWGTPDAS